MALSGSFSTNTGVNLNLRMDWSGVQNTQNNATSVTANLYLVHRSIDADALNGSYIAIDDDSTNYTASLDTGSNEVVSTLLATKTVSISHNNNGDATCTLSGTFVYNGTYGGKYIGTLSVSQKVTLDTIPRASTFTAPASVDTGSSFSMTITKANNDYRHRVELLIDGTRQSLSSYFNTTTYSYTIPHSWLPNDTSKSVTIKLLTYTSNGTTAIGTTQSTITANVPTDITPTVSLAGVIVNGLDGNYVQSKSSIALTATATAGTGATIASYKFNGPNISNNLSTITQTGNTRTSSIITASGALNYSVRLTDSRGRHVDSNVVTITAYPYAAPSLTISSLQRCAANGVLDSSGTYALYNLSGNWSNVNGANTRTITVASSSNGGATYSATTTLVAANNTDINLSGVFGAAGFNIASQYKVRFTITDRYTNASVVVDLGVAERPINFAKYGNGISVGGMSSIVSANADPLFEVNWDMLCRGIIETERQDITGSQWGFGKLGVNSEVSASDYVGDLNNVTTAGYIMTGTAATNAPYADCWYILTMTKTPKYYITQIAVNRDISSEIYFRIRTGGGWRPWDQLVPEETGTNYVKKASGVLECWGKITFSNVTLSANFVSTMYGTNRSLGNYPVAFIEQPTVTLTGAPSTSTYWGVAGLNGGDGTTIGQAIIFRPSAGTISGTIHWRAIGKWK